MTGHPDPEAVLRTALGHSFRDASLLTDACTHSSFRNEKPALVRCDNERLEFLGDAVLQWTVSTLLWERFPEASAGEMTRRRADLVCEEALARIARHVSLGNALRLGKGEERSGGREKPRLLASAFEACVAAVYLDGGTDAAHALCRRLFAPELAEQAPGARDFKTRLQEVLQRNGRKLPMYDIDSVTGPDHARIYRVVILVEGQPFSHGEGRSKLEAEQAGAALALERLESGDANTR